MFGLKILVIASSIDVVPFPTIKAEMSTAQSCWNLHHLQFQSRMMKPHKDVVPFQS